MKPVGPIKRPYEYDWVRRISIGGRQHDLLLGDLVRVDIRDVGPRQFFQTQHRGERDDRQYDHVDRNRLPGTPADIDNDFAQAQGAQAAFAVEQQYPDDRGQATREGRCKLVTQRCPAIARPRPEPLGDQRGLRAIHPGVEDGDRKDDRKGEDGY
jgi:hypothetical protein